MHIPFSDCDCNADLNYYGDFIGRYHWLAGVIALVAYLIVGVVIPMWNGKRGSQKGMEFRTNFGELNSLFWILYVDWTRPSSTDRVKEKEQMSEHSKILQECRSH